MEQGSTTRGVQVLSVSASPSFLTSNGQSMSDAAQRDLDAALQLLAHRAQYITGATGAAIALRRDGKKDMLCRASAGTNAPELGALLSTEVGLSGESVQTKRPLRCDNTLSDTRVNREICQQLGIVSVVVMPVVNDDQVLGVFELFSGKANAFGERDLSAVHRLAEMVQTAVQLARTAQALPRQEKAKGAAAAAGSPAPQGEFVADLVVDDRAGIQKESGKTLIDDAVIDARSQTKAGAETVPEFEASPSVPSVPARKPLFWSAPVNAETDTPLAPDTDQSHVPPVLRDLRKCVACGFPVSTGRMLCVECEEKKWKGQLRSRTSQPAPVVGALKISGMAVGAAPAMSKVAASGMNSVASASNPAAQSSPVSAAAKNDSLASGVRTVSETRVNSNESISPTTHAGDAPEFVLSAAAGPSQSWLSSKKYILIALLGIAAAGAAVVFLR